MLSFSPEELVDGTTFFPKRRFGKSYLTVTLPAEGQVKKEKMNTEYLTRNFE